MAATARSIQMLNAYRYPGDRLPSSSTCHGKLTVQVDGQGEGDKREEGGEGTSSSPLGFLPPVYLFNEKGSLKIYEQCHTIADQEVIY